MLHMAIIYCTILLNANVQDLLISISYSSAQFFLIKHLYTNLMFKQTRASSL